MTERLKEKRVFGSSYGKKLFCKTEVDPWRFWKLVLMWIGVFFPLVFGLGVDLGIVNPDPEFFWVHNVVAGACYTFTATTCFIVTRRI